MNDERDEHHLHVYFHVVDKESLREIKADLAHLHLLAHEVLNAVVTDPEKLAELTAKIKASTEALRAATITPP